MNIHIAKNYQTDEIIYKSYMYTIVGHWMKIEITEIQHKTKNNIFPIQILKIQKFIIRILF